MSRTRVLSSFVLLAGLGAGSCSHHAALETIPNVGDAFPCKPKPGRLLMIASAQLSSVCTIQWQKVQVTVAGDSRIAYISVDDPRFQTPEGIHVGSTLAEVLKTGAEPPRAEPGWAFHTELKSGWKAAFVSGPGMTDAPLSPESRVAWLFRR